TVDGRAPTAQIERRRVRGRDLAHAQLESEVWSTTRRCSVARDRLQPSGGTLQKRERRHQDRSDPCKEWLKNSEHEAHVMEHRQPRNVAVCLRVLIHLKDQTRVMQQVRVREHYAAGLAGRARRVLKKSKIAGCHLLRLPIFVYAVHNRVRGEPFESF